MWSVPLESGPLETVSDGIFKYRDGVIKSNRKYKDYVYRKMLVQEYLKK